MEAFVLLTKKRELVRLSRFVSCELILIEWLQVCLPGDGGPFAGILLFCAWPTFGALLQLGALCPSLGNDALIATLESFRMLLHNLFRGTVHFRKLLNVRGFPRSLSLSIKAVTTVAGPFSSSRCFVAAGTTPQRRNDEPDGVVRKRKPELWCRTARSEPCLPSDPYLASKMEVVVCDEVQTGPRISLLSWCSIV